MQETISQKELEVQESEDKHKKYIEKAKNVIKAMDPKQVPSSMELNILRSQLLERQKMITDLEVFSHLTLPSRLFRALSMNEIKQSSVDLFILNLESLAAVIGYYIIFAEYTFFKERL